MSTAQAHGGLRRRELAALGIDPRGLLDFSTNISPIGPPDAVHGALAAMDVAAYPDPDCDLLVRALSERLDVPPDCILAGNGSTQLIHLIARVFVRQGQRPVVLGPTFGEYAVASELAGGHVYPWNAQPERGFRWNLKNKPEVLRRVAPPLVFLCNPNNPTGVYVSREEVRGLALALTGGPLVLDEAYVGFLDAPWPSLDLVQRGRVIVVRSMTKDYAIAGLRLGYMVAHRDAIAAVRRLQPAWSVGTAAQVAGAAALEDTGYLPRMRAVMREGKALLVEGLRTLGLTVYSGEANFMLAEVGDAGTFREALLHRGFAVRDCTSFGLPTLVRIAARAPDECQALVMAIAALLQHRHDTANLPAIPLPPASPGVGAADGAAVERTDVRPPSRGMEAKR